MEHTISNANAKIVNQSTGIVVAGTDVEGGYFTVNKIETVKSTYDYAQVKGALCYVTEGSSTYPGEQFYQFDGTDWIAVEFGEKGVIAETPNTVVKRDSDANIFVNSVQVVQNTPVNDNELTTKSYVDGLIDEMVQWSDVSSANEASKIVQRDDKGGIFFGYGVICDEAQPIGAADVTPKRYVDAQVNTRVLYSEVNAGAVKDTVVRRDENAGIHANHVVLSANPTAADDATKKAYVDRLVNERVHINEVSTGVDKDTVVRRDANAGIAANYVTLSRTPAYDNEAISVKYLNDKCNESAVGNTIALRTEGGNLRANSFIIESSIDDDNHATSKQYVDELIDGMVPWSAVNAGAVKDTVVRRDENAGIHANHVVLSADPIEADDATKKAYVDAQVNTRVLYSEVNAGAVKDTVVRRDENAGIHANHVVLSANPTAADDATKKSYVDGLWPNPSASNTEANVRYNRAIVYYPNQESGKPHLKTIDYEAYAGDFTIVERNSSGQTCVGDPTEDAHAANKKYVDNAIKKGTTDNTFTNPVILNEGSSDYFPDPTIWSGDDGYFYALATSIGKTMYRSTDLVKWENCGYSPITYEAQSIIRGAGYSDFWAPHVVKIGSMWRMYLACINGRDSAKTGIAVLSSKTCSGYFEFEKFLFTSSDTSIIDQIDPFVDVDPLTNKIWLYFGSTGGIYKCELTPDGLDYSYSPEFVGGLSIKQDGSRERVFEGTSIYYRGNYKYIFVSSGNASTPGYSLKVARARKDTNTDAWGEFFDRDGNEFKYGDATTILSQTSGNYNGPGHCSRVFVDRLGKTYLFYHCHTFYTQSTNWKRATFLQELKWDSENWPYFENGKPAGTETAPYFPMSQPRVVGIEAGSGITGEIQNELDEKVNKNAFSYDAYNKILTINLNW